MGGRREFNSAGDEGWSRGDAERRVLVPFHLLRFYQFFSLSLFLLFFEWVEIGDGERGAEPHCTFIYSRNEAGNGV